MLRPAASRRFGAVRHLLLAHAEVGHLDVAVCAEEKVLEFEVPVDDAAAVEVSDGASDLRRVELGPLLGERELLLEVKVKVPAARVFGDQEEAVVRRKRALQMLKNKFYRIYLFSLYI